AASGGERRQRMRDMVITGKLIQSGKTYAVKGRYLFPDYGLTEVVGNGLTIRALVTPDEVSVTVNGRTEEHTGRNASYSRAGVWRVNLLANAASGRVEARPQEIVAGRPYDVLQVARADGSWPARVLLDGVTHHVFRVIYETDQGEVTDEFGD